MKIYVFMFLLSSSFFEQAYTSSSNWKEIIFIRQQTREIKSIIDSILIPLKITAFKTKKLEALSCYKEAETKLVGVQEISYNDVTDCIRNSKKDITSGIVCAVNVQQTAREASQTVNATATKCISDLSTGDPNYVNKKSGIRDIVFQKANSILNNENIV